MSNSTTRWHNEKLTEVTQSGFAVKVNSKSIWTLMQIQGVLKHVSQPNNLGTGKWQIMADSLKTVLLFPLMRLPAANVKMI